MNLDRYLRRKKSAVERALRNLLPNGSPKQLDRSVRYSLFSPGKRLRPILTIAACEALGGREKAALPAACAVEMIHTYSLIHDDLPSMDDDDFRRGRPSNHRAFDEATAILAGDALQGLAYEVIASNVRDGWIATAMVKELALGSGAAGMVGGQMLDLSNKASITEIHKLKTAALFRTSTKLGALAARAKKARVDKLGEYGENLGLAFQALDDILDEEGDPKAARLRARRCTDRALKAVRFLGKRGETLSQIAEQLYLRKQ